VVPDLRHGFKWVSSGTQCEKYAAQRPDVNSLIDVIRVKQFKQRGLSMQPSRHRGKNSNSAKDISIQMFRIIPNVARSLLLVLDIRL
jgi:hypothetical protein